MSTIKVKKGDMTLHFKKKPEKVEGTCAGCVLDDGHGRCDTVVPAGYGGLPCGGDSILKLKKITP
jgi:hypothetical protein